MENPLGSGSFPLHNFWTNHRPQIQWVEGQKGTEIRENFFCTDNWIKQQIYRDLSIKRGIEWFSPANKWDIMVIFHGDFMVIKQNSCPRYGHRCGVPQISVGF